jgi:hypothetical protein
VPSYNVTISGFVVGDDLDIIRTVTNIPSGQLIDKSWFTVKIRYTDTDARAVFQKIITTALEPTQGHITDTGVTGVGGVLFVLNGVDTILLRPDAEYFYDIQIKTDADKIYTPESGIIIALPSVTSAIS